MFNIQKEEGYALPTVLLIIVIFMIIMLSFMGQAFSSAKQNQVVEKSSQSVALAEMGITYYQVAVQNVYAAKIATINDEVKKQIADDRLKGSLKSNDEYVKLGVSKMKEAIKLGIASEKSKVIIDGKPNSSYSISEINYFEDTKENKILLKVVGNENGKTTTLSTEMNFAPIISGLNNSSGSDYIAPTFNSILEPKPNDPKFPNYCKDPSSIGACGSISVSSPTKSFTDKLNNTSTKTIFSVGDLTFDTPANANNMTLMNIHSDKSITIGGNVQNANKVAIEAMGNLTVLGQLSLTQSTVYVKGNATITKQLFLYSGSKMCVKGSFSAQKVHYKGGILVVKGSMSDSDWAKACGIPPSVNLEWSDKVHNNVNYEY
ncbi:hypothetical protein [Neobacillus sp. 19]|uniref:hypothetical protein n=1 Tax=Neobacillus sp. 19 TaxID=3394458 RepID=UPI003BF6AA5D